MNPREGSLVIQRCRACGTLLAPLIATCSACHGVDLESVSSSGIGSIVSSKVMHRERYGTQDDPVSRTIAIVALDDGPWVYSWIAGNVPTHSGQPARVEFKPSAMVERLPLFSVQTYQGP
ncbi:zinc ribbon domain-containing protein [Rhodococcus opacus]|uniref:Zinc ribbon domain-containing protein n=1 Tax=Rhodococcus opacus TaxID=37919 RepID=A0AAX3Y5K8_RHOOP|nr:OB-fold domain-containing protein [Rhodococcus opacus]MCZ4589791.1 zinc ribbon domain-containing protein [Rhodococcus opacus]WLF44612.1 zinc ribbon domain-containing protein [Rhodococcus opacus]